MLYMVDQFMPTILNDPFTEQIPPKIVVLAARGINWLLKSDLL